MGRASGAVQVVWRRAPIVVDDVALDPPAAISPTNFGSGTNPRHYRARCASGAEMQLAIPTIVCKQRWGDDVVAPSSDR